jgi:hypothetical protein
MPHRAFSRRITAIASNTFTELTRLKVFFLPFALILIGSSLVMARLTFQQEFQVLKDISLGTMSIFTSARDPRHRASPAAESRIAPSTPFWRSRSRGSSISGENLAASSALAISPS